MPKNFYHQAKAKHGHENDDKSPFSSPCLLEVIPKHECRADEGKEETEYDKRPLGI
jgi:hypothetical protein